MGKPIFRDTCKFIKTVGDVKSVYQGDSEGLIVNN